MVAALHRIGLPAGKSDPDYIEMEPLSVIKTNMVVELYKDRVVGRFSFDGAYNRGKVNSGEPVEFDVVSFFDDDGDDRPKAFWHKLGIKTVLAVHSLAIQLLEGKRTCGVTSADHGQLVKSLFMWASNNGSVPIPQGILDGVGCCFGSIIPDHIRLVRRDVSNDRLYGWQKFLSENKKRSLVFHIPPSIIDSVLKTAQFSLVPHPIFYS